MAEMSLAVEKLNDFNYQLWKFRLELVLLKEGVQDVLEAEKPENPDATWKTKDGKARALIGLSIDDSQTCHVMHAKTAREMWLALKMYHARSTLSMKIHILRKLFRMQLPEEGSMADHLTGISQLVNRLRSMGEELKEHWLVAIVLSSLNESYDGLITVLESRPESELKLEFVKGKLLDEWRKRMEKSDVLTTNGKNENVLKTVVKKKPEKKRKEKVCHYCGKEGHFRRECRKLEQDRKYRESEKRNSEKAKIATKTDEELDEVCLTTGLPNRDPESVMWFLDSGATSHMTNDSSLLEDVRKSNTAVGLADGNRITAEGVGTGRFRLLNENDRHIIVKLRQVFHVPALAANLLSISRLTDEGCSVMFTKTECKVQKNGSTLFYAERVGNLYRLKGTVQKSFATIAATDHSQNCIHLWHRRLGHRDVQAVERISRENLGTGLDLTKCSVNTQCGVCYKGKMIRASFPRKSESSSSAVGDLIHTDLCGPLEVATPRGNRYIMTMVDDFSRYCVVYLLRNKSETADKIIEYTRMIQTQFGRLPKILRTDGGGEYSSATLKKFLSENGILLEQTAPYSPQQNGTAERKNRTLQEMMRCLLCEAGLGKQYWGEAVATANYLLNLLPTAVIKGATPFELWWGKKPNYSHLRVFGSEAYVHVPDEKRRKLDPKAKKMIFIGYAEGRKAYRFLDRYTNRVTISRDARFFELVDVTREKDESGSNSSGCFANKKVLPLPLVDEEPVAEDNSESKSVLVNEAENTSESEPEFKEDEYLRRSERTNKGIPPRRLLNEIFYTQSTSDEPQSMQEALSGPDVKEWRKAMKEELESHSKNGTWELVELPAGRTAVGCRWIFKIKRGASNEIVKHKARLVAQGFSQKYGDDFEETFAPVIKQTTLRALLAVASQRNLSLRHLDVKTAYLYGILSEELYMKQPPGFIEKGKEQLVCRLRRSIYGLKQSARCWNQRLHNVLLCLGFAQSETDQCLYVKAAGKKQIYLLVYVDDILLASQDSAEIDRVACALGKEFDITDLGEPSFFLGLEIQRSGGNYSISLENYIDKIVARFGLQSAKSARSPMETGFVSTKDSGKYFSNNTAYRSLVGALLYVAVCGRPDVAVSASILGRKVCAPTEEDWTAAKRVLRYLKATKSIRLQYNSETQKLVGFSDADWAGDVTTRRSTTGYVFLYAGGAISWCSRLQHCVTLSSMESEYVALGEATQEAAWLRRLFADMGEKLDGPTCIMEDNQGCIQFVQSDRISRRSKHIETKEKYIRELCDQGIIHLEYCPTENMAADLLTKPLGAVRIKMLSRVLGLIGTANGEEEC